MSIGAPLSFDGQVVIVTGAGRGLGAAYATLLAARGARVVVNDLGTSVEGLGNDDTPARKVVDLIEEGGGQAVADGSDVSDPAGGARLVARALDSYGRLDGLICNAGIFSEESIRDVDTAVINRHLDVHLYGSLNVVKPAWPHLGNTQGSIVLTLSAAMLGAKDFLAYSIAKAATFGLMRNLAAAGGDDGIRVNAVMPAADTRMQSGAAAELSPERAAAAALSTPEKAAGPVCYLIHPHCQASGDVFAVGRGWTKRLAIGLTDGYGEIDPSVDNVAEHFAEVMALTAIHEVPDAPTFSAKLYSDAHTLLSRAQRTSNNGKPT